MGPYFNSRDKHYKDPFGAVPCGAEVRFALADDTYYGCELLVLREFAGTEDTCALPPAEGGFAGTYTTPAGGELCWYCFRLTDVDGRCVWYGKNGVQDAPEKAARWQLTVYEPSPAPDWFGRGVTYQIFPDRFRRVSMPDVSHMPGHRWLHRGWNEQPVFLPDEHGQITNRDFFGGSLQGITEKLDYLAGLGVTTLYLNPIFEAASNHRYDTGDYRAIDPLLGTEADFRALCTAAHQRGIRVILDGVFNHTGSNSRYFNAEGYYPEPGAAQSQNSEYYNWYSFHPWPSDYDAWWGVKTLPAVNEAQPAYRDFIFGDQDSVVRHWLRCGADGWRLDVADELPGDFIEGIRRAMDAEKPGGYLLGEVWEDGITKVAYSKRRRYLLGSGLHGLMNYPFRTALLSATRGTGIASSISAGYAPWAGQIVTRQNGSMVCDRQGVATPYAMQRLQARGNFFVEPQSPVYEGQVVGINNKPDELDVNITLAKHMTNMRSATADVLETLTPPIKMSLEESLDFANEDECVEVTPESIRVRKIILSREDWYKWRAKQRRQNNAQNNK